MDPLAWPWSIDDADSAAPSVEIPGWAVVETGSAILRMKARVVVRPSGGDLDMMPPQFIISHFRRRRSSSSDVDVDDAAEDAHVTFRQPFYYINFQPAAWREQTQRMFSDVAANRVRPDDLYHLVQGFHWYTYSVVRRFPIAELVSLEFFSVVEIPVTPSASASELHRFRFSPETNEYLFGSDDDDDVDGYIVQSLRFLRARRGPRPASAAAVEGLQMVTAGEGISCPICLDDLEVMSQVLAMPCSHPFHEGCLREWLKRSNSCPVCRFSLPAAAE
ncbi:E3 ubiquitin-protein ligase Iruka-like isoform X1 [Zingiber officinale]|nr:E3 ubiquitin-protein ligase Iruka-like isoform X1 [Zingiber officinale]